MAKRDETQGDADLTAAERERNRHRDRKRETRMVVDNAGVRRVVAAVTRRRSADVKPQPPRDR